MVARFCLNKCARISSRTHPGFRRYNQPTPAHVCGPEIFYLLKNLCVLCDFFAPSVDKRDNHSETENSQRARRQLSLHIKTAPLPDVF